MCKKNVGHITSRLQGSTGKTQVPYNQQYYITFLDNSKQYNTPPPPKINTSLQSKNDKKRLQTLTNIIFYFFIFPSLTEKPNCFKTRNDIQAGKIYVEAQRKDNISIIGLIGLSLSCGETAFTREICTECMYQNLKYFVYCLYIHFKSSIDRSFSSFESAVNVDHYKINLFRFTVIYQNCSKKDNSKIIIK